MGSTRRPENGDTGIVFDTDVEERLAKPPMYAVFVHNDPFTPRPFVVGCLQRFFAKSLEQASRIMMAAHENGVGSVGLYTYEIAEAKANAANTYARSEGYPLNFTVEENEN